MCTQLLGHWGLPMAEWNQVITNMLSNSKWFINPSVIFINKYNNINNFYSVYFWIVVPFIVVNDDQTSHLPAHRKWGVQENAPSSYKWSINDTAFIYNWMSSWRDQIWSTRIYQDHVKATQYSCDKIFFACWAERRRERRRGGVGVTSGCLLLYPGGVNVFQSPV